MMFSGPGVKEIDDFGKTSRINAKFLGDSVEFDAKKHKVRCRRNCLKGIGSKSEVSTGTKHNIRIRRTSSTWGGRATGPEHGGYFQRGSMERHRVSQTVNKFKK